MFENENDRPKSLEDAELEALSKEELIKSWKELNKYRLGLEEREKKNLNELVKLKNIILMNYVSSKEIELTSQFQETHINQAASTNLALSSQQTQQQQSNATNNKQNSFIDPSINAMIIQLRKELDETKKKRDELQMELNATKFTPESQLTRRLMAKCRKLMAENEELGRIISSGNVAQLELDLAYHKQLLNEACENEQNINSFLFEVDNEMENMQSLMVKLKEEKKQENGEGKSKDSSEKKSKKKKTK